MLGFTAFALTACQSTPETSPVANPQPAPAATAASAPAPSNSAVLDKAAAIVPPAKGVPARYAAFSGIWAGQLNGMYDGKLAVLTVSSGGQVTVSYAWGDLADNKPGVADGSGRIVGNTLKLGRLPNGADITATMLSPETLNVAYALAGQTYTGSFARVSQ
ncbi:hypothetical protein RFM68_18610 [Mesorhizobium sp. MSK_1335]|uniref:Lipoprotein n=1 Tax=Mesorhizobium montanum TaxID=3072323 RepID=A0ABU4ZMB6_9HYPH|nr:hypothetical protein [Mesorhizobium sp. MSK_1335]MDX8526516.1 hypothetical protein [Mesorhizobium sp. MSK_1335]